MQMQMKNILFKIITSPLLLLITVLEWMFKLLLKISTVAAGLLINVLLICMFIAICTRQWTSLGILLLCTAGGLLFVFWRATILYIIGEAKNWLSKRI